MKTLLWLDDVRNPLEDDWLNFSPIQHPFKTVWVKRYREFASWIEENGLPDGICFDHDLGVEYHYTNTDVEKDDGYIINYEKYKEKTGFDCAKWLVDYCIDNKLDLPKWNIQSANPVGKENIKKLLDNYEKHAKI